MRGFGVLGLLVTVCIILVLYTGVFNLYQGSLEATQKGGTAAVQAVHRINGLDETGTIPAEQSIQLVMDGRKVMVRWLRPNRSGPVERRYGIAVGDQVLNMGGIPAEDASLVSDRKDAMLWLVQAYSRQQPIIVLRNGEKITLNYMQTVEEDKIKTAPIPKTSQQLGTGAAVPSH
jgi:hypothetical protein